MEKFAHQNAGPDLELKLMSRVEDEPTTNLHVNTTRYVTSEEDKCHERKVQETKIMDKFAADQNADDPLELTLSLEVKVKPTTNLHVNTTCRYVTSEEDKFHERKVQETRIMDKFADQNADPLGLNLSLQVAVKPTTNLHVNTTCRYVTSEEDKFHERKVQETKIMDKFADQNADPLGLNLSLQVAVKPTTNLHVNTTRYVMNELEDKLVNEKKEIVAKKSKKRQRSSTHDHQDDENEKKLKKKIKTMMHVRTPAIKNETIERLKEFVTEEMKGSDLKLVIQKTLYATDLAKNQNRLSMPINQLETLEFLTAEEKRLLDTKDGEIEVPLLGPTLRMHTKPMKLKKWHLKTTCNYVLKTNWFRFVEDNREDLTVNTRVQVWSFRRDERLCFALACVGRADVN